MFIQVIRGKVKDPEAMAERLRTWVKELSGGAEGWLGATAGATDDGTWINIVRFSSEEAARANSQRAEQGEWWQETVKLFEGEPTFYDCPTVDVLAGGGSDDAGFVQVMIYAPSDSQRVRELGEQFDKVQGARPEILGGTTAIARDGTFFDTGYFTSEAEAREGEKKELPSEIQAIFEELGTLTGETEFLDLRNPILVSP